MSPPPITLKGGHFTLTVVHLHHTDPQVIQHALQHKVAQAPAFLSQAPIVINIAKLTAQADWKKIAQAIRAVGLHLIGIAGCCNNEQRQLIQAAGLPLLCEGKGAALQEHTPPTLNINTAKPKCRVIEHPVRSGQQIYASEGDLIVMSTVSAGAEVIAEGHLHLYGVMRGRAIAGAGGDVTRRIFCTHLQAELVSIAGQYWLSDQIPRQFWQSAVTISRQNEQLIIKALS